jgi:hypothetical protein
MTCVIVPSLPAASIAWKTTSSERRPSAYSRSWSSSIRSRSFRRRFSDDALSVPAVSSVGRFASSNPLAGTRKRFS